MLVETQASRRLAPPSERAEEIKRREFEAEALPHLDRLYRVALGYTGDLALAEDWVQETMLRAYRSWLRYEKGTNVRAWLLTILRNAFINHYRRESKMRPLEFSSIERTTVFEQIQETDPEGRFFDEIVDDEVLRAVATLPPDFREALVLSDLEGLSYKEISDVTRVPVGTVKSRLWRGRRMLRRSLYPYALEMGYIRPRLESCASAVRESSLPPADMR